MEQLVSLDLLVLEDSQVKPEPRVNRVLLDPQVHRDHKVPLDSLVLQVTLDQLDLKDLLVIMVLGAKMDNQVPMDNQDHKEIEEIPGIQDLLVLMVNLGHKVNLERKDFPVQLEMQGKEDKLVPEVILVSLDLQGIMDHQDHRVPLDSQEMLETSVLLGRLDLKEPPDKWVHLEAQATGDQMVSQELLGLLGRRVLWVMLGLQDNLEI